jgi:glycosyltransferase involved in cell wall biosynthesis
MSSKKAFFIMSHELKTMKILHIIPNLRKGGAERLCLDICNTLQKKQTHQVQLINFHPTNDYPLLTEKIDRSIIPSSFIPSLTGKNQIQLDALQKAIDSFQPEVIHVHLFEGLIAVSQLTHNAHLIVHFHDNMVQFENFSWKTLFNKRKFTNFFERRIVLRGLKRHKVTYLGISADTFNYMCRVLPHACRKVKLLNGIDTQRFLNPKETSENTNELVELTMIGSLVEKKGQALAIETIAALKKRGINVVLHLLGEGPKLEELKKLSKELAVEELICFHGNVDRPEEFLWKSTLYLHTAKYEPLGLVIIEAMAAGLPVVCTDGRGNRDLMKDGANGFLINSRNPEELADKIQYLLEHDGISKEMGEYAQDFSKAYDIQNYVDRLLEVYTS